MKRLVSVLLFILGGIGIVVLLIGTVMAYFMISYDPETGGQMNGFGQSLSPAPWFIRIFLGGDQDWPGPKWFFIDLAAFWGSVGVLYLIFASAVKVHESAKGIALDDKDGAPK